MGWVVLPPQRAPSRLGVPVGLMEADVVLFCPEAPDLVQNVIVNSQLYVTGGVRTHACFTHVALYTGNGYVHDATPGLGVARRPFEDAAQGMSVRVRRYPGLSFTKRQEICRMAAQLKGQYSRLSILSDQVLDRLRRRVPPQLQPWLQALNNFAQHMPGLQRHEREAFYCSSLVSAAFTLANVGIGQYGTSALPCTLSSDTRLVETPGLKW